MVSPSAMMSTSLKIEQSFHLFYHFFSSPSSSVLSPIFKQHFRPSPGDANAAAVSVKPFSAVSLNAILTTHAYDLPPPALPRRHQSPTTDSGWFAIFVTHDWLCRQQQTHTSCCSLDWRWQLSARFFHWQAVSDIVSFGRVVVGDLPEVSQFCEDEVLCDGNAWLSWDAC